MGQPRCEVVMLRCRDTPPPFGEGGSGVIMDLLLTNKVAYVETKKIKRYNLMDGGREMKRWQRNKGGKYIG